MAWDKKYYREIKKWVFAQLEGGGFNPDIYGGREVFYVDIYISMLPRLAKEERF